MAGNDLLTRPVLWHNFTVPDEAALQMILQSTWSFCEQHNILLILKIKLLLSIYIS